MAAWVEIDGRRGEGGGQVLRTSIALSAVTGSPCHVVNVRAGRPRPGLAAQHLSGVLAAARLCNGRLHGAELGSKEVRFEPGEIRGGHYRIAVGTAGAVTLVLQTLVPIALQAGQETRLVIEGGTDVAWSPLIDYFTQVHCHFLRQMGAEVEVEVRRRGFYPSGGGCVVAHIQPWSTRPEPIDLTERGRVQAVDIWDIASQALSRARVAERQLEGFRSAWGDAYPMGVVNQLYVDSASPGTSFHAHAHCERSRLGSCTIGRRGKRAEIVGREAAALLLEEIDSGAPVDRWMGDQLIPYLGLYGGAITTGQVTDHTRTNVWVTEQFLPRRFAIQDTTVRAE